MWFHIVIVLIHKICSTKDFLDFMCHTYESQIITWWKLFFGDWINETKLIYHQNNQPNDNRHDFKVWADHCLMCTQNYPQASLN